MTGGPRPQQVVAASLPGRGELHEWLPDVGHVSQGVALLNCYEEPATFSRSGPAYLGPRSLARPPRDMASSGGKTPILDLTKYLDRRVRVKLATALVSPGARASRSANSRSALEGAQWKAGEKLTPGASS